MSAPKTVKRAEKAVRKSARRTWVKPDFNQYDTPLEVTAYSARA
ncbi:pyrroloquinoline quinone precursor peptide PqqA [Kutzneria sp. NPDC052558]